MIMYLRRQCYDKPWRCPGWAGGGWQMTYYDSKPADDWTDEEWKSSSARRRHWWQPRHRCKSGTLWRARLSEDPWWSWRWHHCNVCDVVALPHVIRWLDPTWWRWFVVRHVWDKFRPAELRYDWYRWLPGQGPWWWWFDAIHRELRMTLAYRLRDVAQWVGNLYQWYRYPALHRTEIQSLREHYEER